MKKELVDPKVLETILAEKDNELRLSMYLSVAMQVIEKVNGIIALNDPAPFFEACNKAIDKAERKR